MATTAVGLRMLCPLLATLLFAGLCGKLIRWPVRRLPGSRLLRSLAPWLWLALLSPLPVEWSHAPLRTLGLGLLGVLSWKAATVDIDLGQDDPLWNERLFLIASALLSYFNPLFMLPNLFVPPVPLADPLSAMELRAARALARRAQLAPAHRQ